MELFIENFETSDQEKKDSEFESMVMPTARKCNSMSRGIIIYQENMLNRLNFLPMLLENVIKQKNNPNITT